MYRKIPSIRSPFALRRVACCTLLALASLAGAARADTQLAPVIVAAPEDGGPLHFDQPSLTGSRTGLSVRDLPASVDVVTTEAMREHGDFSIKDGITRSTGLTNIGTIGNGGMGFSTRGIAATPGTTSVGIAEDGISLGAASGTINYPVDAWGYQRVEVLRGPASVVFGVGTVGATINAVRNEPSRERKVETLLGFGSHGSVRAGVGATGSLGGNASFRVDAYGTNIDSGRDMGEAKSGKLMTTLRLDPRSDLRFELLADYSLVRPERYFGTPLANGRIDRSLRDENYNVGNSVIRYEDTRLRARAQWQANSWLTLRNEMFLFEADRRWRNVEVYALNSGSRMVARSSYTNIRHDQRQVGNRLEATIAGAGHKIALGWEASKIDFRHSNNAPYGGASTVPDHGFDPGRWASTSATLPRYDSDTTMHALYLEDAYEIDRQWLLLAGLRRDMTRVSRHELQPGQTNFSETLSGNSVRMGLTYRPTADTRLYLQGSTGYDPVSNIVTLTLANRDFSLVRGRQAEAGIKQSFAGGKGDWSAAVYRIEKNDILTRDPVDPTIIVQGGSQHSQGVELTFGVAPVQNWRFEGNFTALRARFDELIEAGGISRAGNRPTNVPEHVANLWGHYRWADWQVSLGARHVGKRYGDNANTLKMPSYTVADASLAWFVDRGTTLRAVLRNLTDKVYATTAYRTTQFLLGESRRVELVAEFKF